MAALRAAKQALRKEMKRRVAALSDEEKRRQSRVVSQKLFRHPKYESTCSHMDMLQLASLQDMETLPLTAWNIRQPAEDDNSREEALAAGGLDLILMPGLGFDQMGKRLGRGKGFYDTYLERCIRHPKGKPYTIALAFREQLCREIPVDDNDVLIDEVLYEDDE
ncbi:putative 5-formyltetrahydrofolate cyclo-ligase isoform 3 [Scophthalmus maximus]|uniref:5-formyltetrahydrofolate cyclo-ligase n=1 Tax=Scophthalmus maximus TaxID=52904 RepID=A0A2U9BDW7_SCOMX|nr:5,10-methenyltetrahydrofolate synthetase (5-formyltetrahydrofolate cyclo-ligase) isoform X2 [Scophthalmus maximus]AWP02114.1 putative 5-formyltetrahydrofolate cyclo-ligase isoform 3 [Scophthalmus maximus]